MIVFPLFVVLLIVAAVSWFCGVVFMFKAAAHARRLQDAPAFIRWNPFNILVRPDLWTPEARIDCHRVVISLGVFIASILASALILLVAGVPMRG